MALAGLVLIGGCGPAEDTPEILHERGRVLLLRNQPQAALEAYKRVLILKPDDPVLHYDVGVASQRLGNVDQALEAYTNAIKFNPDYVQALVNRANLLNLKERYGEAAADCEEAIAIAPTDALAWQNRAAADRGLGELARADADLHVAVALSPDNGRVRLLMALLHLDRKNPERALEAYSRALKNFEANTPPGRKPTEENVDLMAEALAGRSAAHAALGQDEEAKADLERARSLRPKIEPPKPISPRRPTEA